MKITWLGHSAFKLEFTEVRLLIDPFLKGNPAFPGNFDEVTEGVTHILLTHGHGDHLGDAVEVAKNTGACVVADADLAAWLRGRGVEKVEDMNSGGTIGLDGFSVSMVQAVHSSGRYDDGVAASFGEAHGLIVKAPNEPIIYHMGDTDIFGDMALINELHKPSVGIVPIGDRYTMGGAAAGLACRRFFSFSHIIPCHYATFPGLDQTVDVFRDALADAAATLTTPEVGQTIVVAL